MGISALGLGIGLAASACSSGAPIATAPAAATGPTASSRAAHSVAAGTPAAAAAPGSASAAAPSSAPAASTPPPKTPPKTPPPNTAANTSVAGGGPTFVLWDCEGSPQVEPSSYVLACGDGNSGLTGMHWTTWRPEDAAGTGAEYLNDCTPNCATGHFHNYPVDVSLAGSVLVAQDKPFGYTRITLTFTAARPPVDVLVNGKVEVTHPATWSEELPIPPITSANHA
ncbi:MAG TPA: hypothetical protein VIZ43_18345 [Trebonia sp.]